MYRLPYQNPVSTPLRCVPHALLHLTWLDNSKLYLAKNISYIRKHPHYAVFSNLLLFYPFRSKYSPQHPVLKYPHPILFL
jgi:hypothetical protein